MQSFFLSFFRGCAPIGRQNIKNQQKQQWKRFFTFSVSHLGPALRCKVPADRLPMGEMWSSAVNRAFLKGKLIDRDLHEAPLVYTKALYDIDVSPDVHCRALLERDYS